MATATMARPAPHPAAMLPAANPALTRIEQVRDALNQSLIERQGETECLILGLIARKNVLFVGPPGTAKSLLCNALSKAVSCSEFSLLMTKFTSPEELFGMYDLPQLKNGVYQRITQSMLPECELAFLDEVFRGSSAIMNTLLTIMNEKTFKNGTVKHQTPVRAIIGGSNDWPVGEGQQELGAFFDRFLIRKSVKQVSPARQDDLVWGSFAPVHQVATMADFDAAAAQAELIQPDPTTIDVFETIRAELKAAGLIVGDRRYRDAASVARAAAWLDGSPVVLPKHLAPLQHVLWSDPLQISKTAEVVVKNANPDSFRVLAKMAEADQIFTDVPKDDKVKGIEALNKIKTVVRDLQQIAATSSPAQAEAQEALTIIQGRHSQLAKVVLNL